MQGSQWSRLVGAFVLSNISPEAAKNLRATLNRIHCCSKVEPENFCYAKTWTGDGQEGNSTGVCDGQEERGALNVGFIATADG
jgi:hypothetical protein